MLPHMIKRALRAMIKLAFGGVDKVRILGIDPGTGILGFGVIEASKGKAQLVDAGVIRTPVKEDDAVRLQTIYEEISDIIASAKPDAMSVERLFFARNVTTA